CCGSSGGRRTAARARSWPTASCSSTIRAPACGSTTRRAARSSPRWRPAARTGAVRSSFRASSRSPSTPRRVARVSSTCGVCRFDVDPAVLARDGTWHVPGTYLARTRYVPGTYLVPGRLAPAGRRRRRLDVVRAQIADDVAVDLVVVDRSVQEREHQLRRRQDLRVVELRERGVAVLERRLQVLDDLVLRLQQVRLRLRHRVRLAAQRGAVEVVPLRRMVDPFAERHL